MVDPQDAPRKAARPAPRGSRTPSTELRQIVLNAARSIIEEDGYSQFTIRLLSEKAGVSPTSIYKRVGDKRDVITALVSDDFRSLREDLLKVVDRDPLVRLYRAGQVYRSHAQASPGVYRLLWQVSSEQEALYCLSAIAEIIRYGQVAGKFRQEDPDKLAKIVWSSVHGFVQLEQPENPESIRFMSERDEEYDLLLRTLLRGIVTDSSVVLPTDL